MRMSCCWHVLVYPCKRLKNTTHSTFYRKHVVIHLGNWMRLKRYPTGSFSYGLWLSGFWNLVCSVNKTDILNIFWSNIKYDWYFVLLQYDNINIYTYIYYIYLYMHLNIYICILTHIKFSVTIQECGVEAI